MLLYLTSSITPVEIGDVVSLSNIEKLSIVALLSILLWVLFKRLQAVEDKRESEREKYIKELKELKKDYDYKFELMAKDIFILKEDSTQALREVSDALRAINETNKEVKLVLDQVIKKLDS